MATAIGHLALLVSAQSSLATDLKKDEKRIQDFASKAKGKTSELFKGTDIGESLAGGMGSKLAKGGLIAAGIMYTKSKINEATQATGEWAKQIREVEGLLGTAAERAEALRNGLLAKDGDSILANNAEIEKANKPGFFSRQWSGLAGVWAQVQNQASDLIDSMRGVEVQTTSQTMAAKAAQEAQLRFLKQRKEFIQSQADEMLAIKHTAAELKILKLEWAGLSKEEANAFRLNAANIERLKEEAESVKKFKDELKSLNEFFDNGIGSIGQTAMQKRLKDFEEMGPKRADLERFRNMAELVERLEESFKLIEKDPVAELARNMRGLGELLALGKISWDEYNRTAAKLNEVVVPEVPIAPPNLNLPGNLERGSAAEVAFRNNMTKRSKEEEAIRQLGVKMDEQIEQLEEANDWLRDSVESSYEFDVITVP